MYKIILFSVFMVSFQFLDAQTPVKDKGKYINYENAFWNEIQNSVNNFEKKEDEKAKKMYMDFSNHNLPKSIDEFKKVWYNEPVSQGWTNTCWCFSATSFLESEIFRLTNKKVKLSEMHTVYYEYIEKAKRYVEQRGNSSFGEGSQANAVLRMWKKYGAVPEEVFSGLKPGQTFHGHEKMFNEVNNYLQSVKNNNAWNEEEVVSTVKAILNHYISEPPTVFNYNGMQYTPIEYLNNELKLNTDDYVSFMSLMEFPYYTQQEYKVPDNWWKCDEYYNIPLDEFVSLIRNAVEKGYSIAIGGDVSESGYFPLLNAAMVPSYDIPSEYIDENARQFRFNNGTTTDDHGVHIVGVKKADDGYWYLIKDSGSGSRNGTSRGYYFWHEDYIKLKMMNFTIHKSFVTELLKKFGTKSLR